MLRECGSAAFHYLHFPGLVALHQGLLAEIFELLCEKKLQKFKTGCDAKSPIKLGQSIELKRSLKDVSVMFPFCPVQLLQQSSGSEAGDGVN